MLAAIDGAKRRISFETYIYDNGRSSPTSSPRRSKQAARRGVQVNLVVDAMGASGDGRKSDIERLEAAGCRDRRVQQPNWYSLEELNYRTHRKILVVDGEIGFTGGVGVADHWLGHAQDKEHWRDTQVRHARSDRPADGGGFYENFIEDRRRVDAGARRSAPPEPTRTARRSCVRSSPTGGSNDLKRLYLLSIAVGAPDARHQLAVLRHRRIERLGARRRGAARRQDPDPRRRGHHRREAGEVRLPRRLRAAAARMGIEIYEYQPTMMHAKAMVVDGVVEHVRIGELRQPIAGAERRDERRRRRSATWPRASAGLRAGPARARSSSSSTSGATARLEKAREHFWSYFGEIF